jgi:hypothetical protein
MKHGATAIECSGYAVENFPLTRVAAAISFASEFLGGKLRQVEASMARVRFLVYVSLLIASAAFSQDPPATKSQGNKGNSLSMPMVAPLFLEDNDFSSTVTLAQ